MIMNTVAKSGFLGRPQKSHFFQPSEKSQFSLKIYPLKTSHRKNSIANFYDAVHSRFRIYKLLFQKKKKKSPKI